MKKKHYNLSQIEAMIDVIIENLQFWNGKIPEEIQVQTKYEGEEYLITVFQSHEVNTSRSIDPRDDKTKTKIYESWVRVTGDISPKDLINEVEKAFEEQREIYHTLNM